MPIDHYENFPVASVLLPRRLRAAVEAIYAFARSADDLADEGEATPEQRLAALNAYQQKLDQIAAQQPLSALSDQLQDLRKFQRLQAVITRYQLPLQPFYDLLSAFKQDVVTLRYASYASMLDYCRRSANPVGTLMLHLYGAATPENLRDSDAICTALQIINFWQDIAIDWKKNRVYLPVQDLQRFGLTEQDIASGVIDDRWRYLLQYEIHIVRERMLSGAPLAKRLPGRIGWELRLVIQGGLLILEKIEAVDYDIFQHRPTLDKKDWMVMAWRALQG